jgi:murein DD-endopeptidase MepM/ murein hydrolase activator NlpD
MTPLLARQSALAVLCLLLPFPASGASVTKRVGQVTFVVEDDAAVPGGFFVARLLSRRGVGSAYAILDGRRAPAYSAARGPRALVPIPADGVSGGVPIGFEILSRKGRQRIPVDSAIAPRQSGERRVELGAGARALLMSPESGRDERILLGLLRTQSLSPPEALRPPIGGIVGRGFGDRLLGAGGTRVAQRIDGTWGEFHRGLDFAVPSGTAVRSPGRGKVLLAAPLTLAGNTVVIDHGQGLLSVLMHLTRVDIAAGDTVFAGAPVGLSGVSALTGEPVLEWRTYIHGIAVDPSLVQRSLD